MTDASVRFVASDDHEVAPIPGTIDDAAIADCLKEAQAGRADPDPLKVLECMQKKAQQQP